MTLQCVVPQVHNKGFDLIRDIREISEELMSEMKSEGIGLTRAGGSVQHGACVFKVVKDSSVTTAQTGRWAACMIGLDSSQAIHREPLKCLSGQAM